MILKVVMAECRERYQESKCRLREDKDPTLGHPTLEGEEKKPVQESERACSVRWPENQMGAMFQKPRLERKQRRGRMTSVQCQSRYREYHDHSDRLQL